MYKNGTKLTYTEGTKMRVEKDTTTWKLHVNKDHKTVATIKCSLPPPL